MTAIALNTMCLIADGRSIHARRWAMHLTRAGITGTLLSSRRLPRAQRWAWRSNCGGFQVIEPTDAWNVGRQAILAGMDGSRPRRVVRSLLAQSASGRGRSVDARSSDVAAGDGGRGATLDLWAASRLARRLEALHREQPLTLVHALRIPFEGVSATRADVGVPVVVSTRGQDLQAPPYGRIAEHARRALARCDGFMADISSGVPLAESFGLPASTPRLVVPGNMGLDVPVLRAVLARGPQGERPPLVVYARGISAFVDATAFLETIPGVLRKRPDAHVVCVGMGRDQRAVEQARAFGTSVELVDFMSQDELWELFAHASVIVSPGRSDGLPNSVLEATALGAVPVVYQLPYAEELMASPVQGYAVPHGDVEALTAATVEALTVPATARRVNSETVLARYGAEPNLERVMEFYDQLVR
ncbi:glycosyltransferase family 4 protein [Actinopolymorpha pittospori]